MRCENNRCPSLATLAEILGPEGQGTYTAANGKVVYEAVWLKSAGWVPGSRHLLENWQPSSMQAMVFVRKHVVHERW